MDKKRWWMSPSGESMAPGYGLMGESPGWDGSPGVEVQVVPMDAVVLEKGTREWAVVMAMRGKRMTVGYHKDEWGAADILLCPTLDGWHELPAPWAPQRGDRVRWTRGKDSGTGTYKRAVQPPYTMRVGHQVFVGDVSDWFVETVSPMEEP